MISKIAVIAGSMALAASAPAAAEVVSVNDGGFVTRDTASVSADPKTTWLALISPGTWWSDEHSWSGDAANMTLTPQGGGCFCERIPGVDTEGEVALDGSAQHMTVVQAVPMKVLRMRGGLGPLQGEPVAGVLTITLKDVDGGTRILWEYVVGGPMRYPVADISKAVDGVMSQQLASLAETLGRIDGPQAEALADDTPADGIDEDAGDVGAAIDAMGSGPG